MITVQKMFDDLDYWIMIGIGDDIVNIPAHRQEYQHLVARAKRFSTDKELIPKIVLNNLSNELKRPALFRPTFWRLIWLKVTGKI